MNDHSLRRYVLASLALTLAPSGCATILGLDDFTEGSGTGTSGGGGAGGIGGMTSSSSSTGGGEGTSSSASSSSSTGGACVDGTTLPCYSGPAGTEGKGPCLGGTATCKNSMYGACTGEKLPTPEVCTMVGDENCDGIACSEAKWAKTFDDSNYSEVFRTAVDGQGNVFAAGVFSGTLQVGNLPALGSGQQDFFLVKFDSAGTALWAKGFGDAASNAGSITLAVDKSGNAVIAGGIKGAANFGGGVITNQGATDVFVAKYDPAGNYKWGTTFGGAADESARAVAIDSQGDVILAGAMNGTLTFGGATFTAGGNQNDAFLTKLAGANGAHLWSNHYAEAAGQANSNQLFNDIAIGPGDYIHAVAFFNKSANFGGAPFLANQALVVARYDSAGNPSWSMAFGTGQALGHSMAVDSAGNISVLGNLTGTINFGGADLSSMGASANICVAQFDSTGAHKWSKVFPDNASESGAGIATDGAKNIIITGDVIGSANFGGGVLPSGGGHDIFLLKLDSGGTHLWSKTFGDAADQVASAVGVDLTPASATSNQIVLAALIKGVADFGTGAQTSPSSVFGTAVLAKFQP